MFKSLIDIIKGNNKDFDIEEENKQLRKKNKYNKKEIDEINSEKEELARKYIDILEEKANGFDQYLKYFNLCEDQSITIKSQKKEIAELKEKIKELTEENISLLDKIEKKNMKIKKCNEKVKEMEKKDE